MKKKKGFKIAGFPEFADRFTADLVHYIKHNYDIMNTRVEVKGSIVYVYIGSDFMRITIEAEQVGTSE